MSVFVTSGLNAQRIKMRISDKYRKNKYRYIFSTVLTDRSLTHETELMMD